MTCRLCDNEQQAKAEFNDLEERLVIADKNTLLFQCHSRRSFYRVLELIEDRGREFFVVEQ